MFRAIQALLFAGHRGEKDGCREGAFAHDARQLHDNGRSRGIIIGARGIALRVVRIGNS